MNFSSLNGKIFKLNSEEQYGPIRPIYGELPDELTRKYKALAEDSCGNYFITQGGDVLFWDHETSEVIKLSSSFDGFKNRCIEPEDIVINESEVEFAWIDPNFLKSIETDENS